MNPEAVFLQRMVLSYSYGVLAFQTASVGCSWVESERHGSVIDILIQTFQKSPVAHPLSHSATLSLSLAVGGGIWQGMRGTEDVEEQWENLIGSCRTWREDPPL